MDRFCFRYTSGARSRRIKDGIASDDDWSGSNVGSQSSVCAFGAWWLATGKSPDQGTGGGKVDKPRCENASHRKCWSLVVPVHS